MFHPFSFLHSFSFMWFIFRFFFQFLPFPVDFRFFISRLLFHAFNVSVFFPHVSLVLLFVSLSYFFSSFSVRSCSGVVPTPIYLYLYSYLYLYIYLYLYLMLKKQNFSTLFFGPAILLVNDPTPQPALASARRPARPSPTRYREYKIELH
jgi:hypothetical protein